MKAHGAEEMTAKRRATRSSSACRSTAGNIRSEFKDTF